MDQKSKNMTVMVDGYTRVMLTIIAVLLTVLSVGLWCETPQMSQSAAAGRIRRPRQNPNRSWETRRPAPAMA